MTIMYICCAFMVVFGVVGLIKKIYDISENDKKDMLDEMFKNNDISTEVYKKYKK